MSRMFTYDGEPMKTWNVWVGCQHECIYCSAEKLARGRLKNIERYKDGFHPHLVRKELERTFHPGQFIFVGYMGDISFAPPFYVEMVLAKVRAYPETRFLFCTKNPGIYHKWRLTYPSNLYLGVTIESNFDHGVSKAPPPAERYEAMRELQHPHKLVSMEPLLDFDLATLVSWMKEIKPEIIEIGPDNYHNNLPEPLGTKVVIRLLSMLREVCPTVVEKPGLSRLLGISKTIKKEQSE